VGTPPPIRMKKKSKERARDEKTSSLPFKTPPLPQQNLLAAVFLVPNRKERELLSTQKRARNDYDERIPTLSKEWERTSNRDLMRRKRRRERRRRTPSAKTARSRRERETHVVRFDPREQHAFLRHLLRTPVGPPRWDFQLQKPLHSLISPRPRKKEQKDQYKPPKKNKGADRKILRCSEIQLRAF